MAERAAYDWSGFYVGGSAGFDTNKTAVSASTVNGTTPLYNDADITSLNAFNSAPLDSSKFIVGVKTGYNGQFGQFVLGLQADIFQRGIQNDHVANDNPFAWGSGYAMTTLSTTQTTLLLLRGRLGYSFDNVLIYATYGLANGKINFSNSYSAYSYNGSGMDIGSVQVDKYKSGYVIGGGIDYAFAANWILTVEFMHVDLGSISAVEHVTTGYGAEDESAYFNFRTSVTDNIFSVGVAYKY